LWRHADIPYVITVSAGRRKQNRVGGRRPTGWNWIIRRRGGRECSQSGVDQRSARASSHRVTAVGGDKPPVDGGLLVGLRRCVSDEQQVLPVRGPGWIASRGEVRPHPLRRPQGRQPNRPLASRPARISDSSRRAPPTGHLRQTPESRRRRHHLGPTERRSCCRQGKNPASCPAPSDVKRIGWPPATCLMYRSGSPSRLRSEA